MTTVRVGGGHLCRKPHGYSYQRPWAIQWKGPTNRPRVTNATLGAHARIAGQELARQLNNQSRPPQPPSAHRRRAESSRILVLCFAPPKRSDGPACDAHIHGDCGARAHLTSAEATASSKAAVGWPGRKWSATPKRGRIPAKTDRARLQHLRECPGSGEPQPRPASLTRLTWGTDNWAKAGRPSANQPDAEQGRCMLSASSRGRTTTQETAAERLCNRHATTRDHSNLCGRDTAVRELLREADRCALRAPAMHNYPPSRANPLLPARFQAIKRGCESHKTPCEGQVARLRIPKPTGVHRLCPSSKLCLRGETSARLTLTANHMDTSVCTIGPRTCLRNLPTKEAPRARTPSASSRAMRRSVRQDGHRGFSCNPLRMIRRNLTVHSALHNDAHAPARAKMCALSLALAPQPSTHGGRSGRSSLRSRLTVAQGMDDRKFGFPADRVTRLKPPPHCVCRRQSVLRL